MKNQNRGDNQDPYVMTKDWLILSKDDFKNKYGKEWTPPEDLVGKVKKELSIRKDKKGEYRNE